MQRPKKCSNHSKTPNQKISYPHIVDKVVNNSLGIQDIVYNSFFDHIVFYLNTVMMTYGANTVLDL